MKGMSACSILRTFNKFKPTSCRAKPQQERVIEGLLWKTPPYIMDLEEILGKVRSVVVREAVPKGAYILEYKSKVVYPREKRKQYEMYASNDEPSMMFDIQTISGWYCIDATRKFGKLCCLLNHAPPRRATVKPFKSIFIKSKWRGTFSTN